MLLSQARSQAEARKPGLQHYMGLQARKPDFIRKFNNLHWKQSKFLLVLQHEPLVMASGRVDFSSSEQQHFIALIMTEESINEQMIREGAINLQSESIPTFPATLTDGTPRPTLSACLLLLALFVTSGGCEICWAEKTGVCWVIFVVC